MADGGASATTQREAEQAASLKLRSDVRWNIFAAATVLPFCILLYRYAALDFYYDELYSLIHYVIVPLKKTAFEYMDANNHYLSNIFNNLFLKAIGENDVYSLMDYPWAIRLFQLVYVIPAFPLFYVLVLRRSGRPAAIIALMLLATTIPYHNYVLQMRGYSLSVLLMIVLLWFLWEYERSRGMLHGYAIVVSCALFLYSMPSNLYALSGIVVFYAAETLLIPVLAKRTVTKSANGAGQRETMRASLLRDVSVLGWLGAGALAAAGLYAPILKGMLNDPQLRSAGLFYLPTLTKMMPSVLTSFVSWRWMAVVFAAAGIALCMVRKECRANGRMRRMTFSAAVLVIPFAASFIRGDRPYDRHFLALAPLFCILVGEGMAALVEGTALRKRFPLVAGALFVYLAATFVWGINRIERKIADDIIIGNQSVGITYNYFQAHYAPHRLVRLLMSLSEQYPPDIVPLVVNYCDRLSMIQYLNKYEYKVANIHRLPEFIHLSPTWLVISGAPFRHRSEFAARYPDYELKLLNDPLQFHNLFLMTRKSDTGSVQQSQGQSSRD